MPSVWISTVGGANSGKTSTGIVLDLADADEHQGAGQGERRGSGI